METVIVIPLTDASWETVSRGESTRGVGIPAIESWIILEKFESRAALKAVHRTLSREEPRWVFCFLQRRKSRERGALASPQGSR